MIYASVQKAAGSSNNYAPSLQIPLNGAKITLAVIISNNHRYVNSAAGEPELAVDYALVNAKTVRMKISTNQKKKIEGTTQRCREFIFPHISQNPWHIECQAAKQSTKELIWFANLRLGVLLLLTAPLNASISRDDYSDLACWSLFDLEAFCVEPRVKCL